MYYSLLYERYEIYAYIFYKVVVNVEKIINNTRIKKAPVKVLCFSLSNSYIISIKK